MYQVFNREGKVVMQSEENIRYDKHTEKEMIKIGYVIKIDGKKIK